MYLCSLLYLWPATLRDTITLILSSNAIYELSVSHFLYLKFHWDQFPRNFPVANVTGKSPTSYAEVNEEADDFQTISTCQDGLACR